MNPTNPYPQYPPPGQGVHAGYPAAQPAAGYGPPPGYGGAPAGPPPGYPPQPQAYPAGPPPAYPAGPPAAPPAWSAPQAALPPAVQAALQESREAHSGDGDFDDIEWFTPNKGASVGQTAETVIRILPHWSGNVDMPFWFFMHRHFCTVTLEGGKRQRLPRPCPRQNTPKGQAPRPCPICERAERADQAGDKDMGRELRAKGRYFFNVLAVETPQAHFPAGKQPRAMVWGVGPQLFTKLSNLMGSRGQIWHPQFGRMMRVYATKTGNEDKDVRYDLMDTGEPCPIPAGMEVVQPVALDQLAVERPYAEMAREIATTYPDGAGMPMMAPPQLAAPAQAAPPYGNPYGGQPAQPAWQAPAPAPQPVGPPPGWNGQQAAAPAQPAPYPQPAQYGQPPGWSPPPQPAGYPAANQPVGYGQGAPPAQSAYGQPAGPPPGWSPPPQQPAYGQPSPQPWSQPPVGGPAAYPPGTQFGPDGKPIPF